MILTISGFTLCAYLFMELRKLQGVGKLVYKDLIIKYQNVLIQYAIVLGAIIALSYTFRMRIPYIFILVGVSMIVFIKIVKTMNQFNRNYTETTQFILVLTHLSHQFKTHQKIEHALLQVMEVCDETTRKQLEVVYEKIELESYQEAFSHYHDHYLLRTLVTTMAHAQEQGDDNIMHALNLIEQDIDDLNNHIFMFIRNMMGLRNRIVLLSCFGMVVSLVSQNMLHMVVDITTLGLYQDVVFIFMVVMVILVGSSFNILTLPLIMAEECLDDC